MNLEQVREYVAALQGEIARMPHWKNGTQWHTDRVREIEAMERTIARMEAAK